MVGLAGVGKTTMLKAAREIWESNGLTVRGAAVAWDAAQTLRGETGIASQSLAEFLQAYRERDRIRAAVAAGELSERQAEPSLAKLRPAMLTANHVLVVDEAGQLGTEDLALVVRAVREADARLVLVGDDTQFQAISAGRAFAGAIEDIGAARVTDIRRQRADAEDVVAHRNGLPRDEARAKVAALSPAERADLVRQFGADAERAGMVWRRDAAQLLAAWETRAALDLWAERGFVAFDRDRAQAMDRLTRSYFEQLDRGVGLRDQDIFAFTNADVAALNQRVQDGLRARGAIGADAFTAAGKTFAFGDRIVFSEGDKRGRFVTVTGDVPVYRNTRGTLTDYRDGLATVALDDGRTATFRPEQFDKIDLGYARTLYKGQGRTVGGDETGVAHILASEHMRADATYVAGTRSKFDTLWYAACTEFAGMAELATALGRSPRKDLVRDYELPERENVTRIVRDFLSARRDYAEVHAAIIGDANHTGRMSAHPRWAELQDAKHRREFAARLITANRDRFEAVTRRAGLSWEALEIAAGLRVRPLTTAEVQARTEAFRYGMHAEATRDLWNRIKAESARGRYTGHPLFAEFERMRAVRDTLAVDIAAKWERYQRWAQDAGLSRQAVQAQAAAARGRTPNFDLGPYLEAADARAQQRLSGGRIEQAAGGTPLPAHAHYTPAPLGPTPEAVAQALAARAANDARPGPAADIAPTAAPAPIVYGTAFGPTTAEQAEQVSRVAQTVLRRVGEHDATVTERGITERIAALAPTDETVRAFAHAAVMQDPNLVALGRDTNGEVRFTSASYRAAEAAYLSEAQASAVAPTHPVDAAARARLLDEQYGWLTRGQRAAVEHMTEAHGVSAVIGRAGVGKTTMMRAAREVWEEAGYRVRGAALSWNAAQLLDRETGIRSESVARVLFAYDVMARAAAADAADTPQRALVEWAQSVALRKGDVLVLDEAGQLSTRELGTLIHHAQAAGAKIVAVGDERQFEAIGAGRAFAALVQDIGAAEVTEMRRQRADAEDVLAHRDGLTRAEARARVAALTPADRLALVRTHGPDAEAAGVVWRREAAAHFAEGRARDGLALYHDRGHLHFERDQNAAMARLVARYFERHDGGVRPSEQAVYAFTNAQVDALNTRIRAELVARGSVGPVQVDINGYGFGIGDRIAFTEADRRGEHVAVANGPTQLLRNTTGTVVGIERQDAGLTVTVALDDGRTATFDPAKWEDVRHAYASTLYKAQGQTIGGDEQGVVHVLASPHMRADSTYVAFTRSRHDTDLYVGRDDFAGLTEVSEALGRAPRKDLARDYIGDEAERRNAVVAAFREDRAQLAQVMARINREIGPDEKPWHHPEWKTARMLKESRDQGARVIAGNRTAYEPVLRRAGLSWEAVAVVLAPETRALKTADQLAKARTASYQQHAQRAADLWKRISATHPGARAAQHPLAAAYSRARDARDRIAADIVQDWPAHRRWAQEAGLTFAPVRAQAAAHAERAGFTFEQLFAGQPQSAAPVPHSLSAETATMDTPERATATLETALRRATRPTPWDPAVPDPLAHRVLQDGRGHLAEVADALRRHGVTELRPFSGGASSVVLDAGTRVVRLGIGRVPERAPIPEMLRAEAAGSAGPIRWEIVPKVTTIDQDPAAIREADVARMADALRARGYAFSDPGRDNLGRLADGRVVVIDPGAVRPLTQAEAVAAAAPRPAQTWLIPPSTETTRDSLGRSLDDAALRAVVTADAKVQEHDRRFITALASTYRQPQQAAQQIEALAATKGVRAAQLAMDRDPAQFGELRGREGVFVPAADKQERQDARQAAYTAATALGDRAGAAERATAEYRAAVTAQIERDRTGIPAISPEAQRFAARVSRMEHQPERVARLFAKQTPEVQREFQALMAALQKRYGAAVPKVYQRALAQQAQLSPKAYLAFARQVRATRRPAVTAVPAPQGPAVRHTTGGATPPTQAPGKASKPRVQLPARGLRFARRISNFARNAAKGSVSFDPTSTALLALRVLEKVVPAKLRPIIAVARIGLTTASRLGGGLSH